MTHVCKLRLRGLSLACSAQRGSKKRPEGSREAKHCRALQSIAEHATVLPRVALPVDALRFSGFNAKVFFVPSACGTERENRCSHTAAGRKFVVFLHVALEDLATPLDSSTQSSVRNIKVVYIILFRWINSSASQATQNALGGTPRPPHKGISKCDKTLILPMLTERCFRLKNLCLRTPHALHVAVDAKCICSEAV